MLRFAVMVMGALSALVLSGCSQQNTPAVMSQEDKVLLDRIRAKERAKADLLAAPDRFVQGTDWDRFDSGIINSYTRTTAIVFTNKSEFDVADPSGHITYLRSGGAELATVPFAATGEVPAGRSVRLKVDSNEVTGKAASARIKVERVRVRG